MRIYDIIDTYPYREVVLERATEVHASGKERVEERIQGVWEDWGSLLQTLTDLSREAVTKKAPSTDHAASQMMRA